MGKVKNNISGRTKYEESLQKKLSTP